MRWLGLYLTFATGCAFAQAPGTFPKRVSSRVEWKFDVTPVPLLEGAIEVGLPEETHAMRYAVAILPQLMTDGDRAEFAAADVKFRDDPGFERLPIKFPVSVTNIPPARLEARPGAIRVASVGSDASALIVELKVAPETTVRLRRGPRLVFARIVSEPVLIKNDIEVPRDPRAIQPGVSLTAVSYPVEVQTKGELHPTARGYFVPQGAFLRNVAQGTVPWIPEDRPRVACCPAIATLELEVDEIGNVTSSRLLSAGDDASVAREAEALVQGWRFKPFLLKGRPVRVRGWVSFYRSLNDGRLGILPSVP